MKSEYDFTKGERGKFFRPSVELNIPIYLDPEIAEAVRELLTTLDDYRASVARIENRAVFEIPEILAKILEKNATL